MPYPPLSYCRAQTHFNFLSFCLPVVSAARNRYSPVLQSRYRWSKCQDLLSLLTFLHQDIISWIDSPPPPRQNAIFQKLKKKKGRKQTMKSKPCLNFTSLQWPVPSVTQSKWLKLMPYNVWSDKCRVTKTNKKERSRKKRRKKKKRGKEWRTKARSSNIFFWRVESAKPPS